MIEVYEMIAMLIFVLGLLWLPMHLQAAQTAAPNVVVDHGQPTLQAPQPQPIASPMQGTPVTQGNQIPEAAAAKDATIYLNFEGAALSSVLNYLGEQKKINIVPNKDLEGVKVSLNTRTPMTLAQAFDVLLTLMDINGFSLINVNGVYRVVPVAASGQEVLPVYSSYTGTEPEDLPEKDLMIRYVYFLKNMRPDSAKGILGKMMDERNILVNQDLSAVIIKDTSLNIKSALKVIKELDLGGLRESMEIIQLQYTSADNVQKIFSDILNLSSDQQQDRVIRFSGLNQKDSAYFSNQTKIVPEPTRNMVILLGTQKHLTRIKDFIRKYIDVPIENAESRLHIKELRYIKAQDLKPILDEIVKPPRTATDKSLIVEGGFKVFEDVLISAEVDQDQGSAGRGGGNRLVVAANRDDWQRLEDFIDKLDKPQPQVAIEAMVVDVNLNQIKELGTQLFNLKGKPFAKNLNLEFLNISDGASNLQAVNPATPPYLSIAGGDKSQSSFITLGQPGSLESGEHPSNIWALIRATFGITNQQVITQPYQVVNNNQKCSLSIKETRHILGGIDSSKLQTVQKYDDVDAAISVDLTPYINLNGNVDLNIEVSVNEFLEGTTDATSGNRTTRHIVTKSSMATGEVLVIGGLIKSTLRETVQKTPILSDIPVVGTFFKNKRKEKAESNLYIFIRPSIIKPRFDGSPDEYTQLKLDYAKLQIMKNDTYVTDKDPIQRFYFKPSNQTIQAKINDANRGILRPIDNFTYGRTRPKTVDISDDPYFKVAESIEKAKAKRKLARAQLMQAKQEVMRA